MKKIEIGIGVEVGRIGDGNLKVGMNQKKARSRVRPGLGKEMTCITPD